MVRALPLLVSPRPRPRPMPAVSAPRSVRVSLTDRCDLACVYCRPHKQDGYLEKTLDSRAWRALLEGLALAGVRRVRITGGEPLLYPAVVEAVALACELGFEDIALTTNATRLARLAEPLRRAGLMRVNVSLDTLDPERFARMTRGGKLGPVLEGIEAARQVGFAELKLNVVVLRSENDEELPGLVHYAWERGIVPRMLEVMAIGEGARIQDRVVPYSEMRERLAPLLEDEPPRRDEDRGPARYVHARHDPRLRVGFITGTTDTYCKGCDRLRVAADGMLRPCLATNDGVEAEAEARSGDAEAVRDLTLLAWTKKPDGDTFKGCTEESASHVSIRKIGG